MIIHNVRLGFATNSSSAHSIVIWPTDDIPEQNYFIDINSEFGREKFVLSSEFFKLDYLSQMLAETLKSQEIDDDLIIPIIESWIGHYDKEGYIDHQSLFYLPHKRIGRGIDIKFYEEFKKFLLNKNVIIIGGSDEDYPYVWDDPDFHVMNLWRINSYPSVVARKDEVYGYWTLFNKNNGTKIRLSLNPQDYSIKTKKQTNFTNFIIQTKELSQNISEFCLNKYNKDCKSRWYKLAKLFRIKHKFWYDYKGIEHFTVTKSSAPELIDLKITNKCDRGCDYCYQSSTHDGKHADYNFIETIIRALKDLEVFEIALGGGEPMGHSKFINMLWTCKYYGIVPNFSTRKIDWLCNQKLAKKIFDNIGGVAFSVDTGSDVDRIVAILNEIYIPDNVEISFQTIALYSAIDVIKAINYHKNIKQEPYYKDINLTFLGFKPVGRAKLMQDVDYIEQEAELFEWIKENKPSLSRISIDTTLANRNEQALKELDIWEGLYDTKDGAFSMYIDAVNGTMHKASYDESEGVCIDTDEPIADQIRKFFKGEIK